MRMVRRGHDEKDRIEAEFGDRPTRKKLPGGFHRVWGRDALLLLSFTKWRAGVYRVGVGVGLPTSTLEMVRERIRGEGVKSLPAGASAWEGVRPRTHAVLQHGWLWVGQNGNHTVRGTSRANQGA